MTDPAPGRPPTATVTAARDVGARLRQLASRVPVTDASTAERVRAVDRRRRQRGARWVAAAAAVVVLGGGAVLARPTDVPAAAETVPVAEAVPATAPPPAMYEQPPRGSLADDAGLLAQAAALPWSKVVDPGSGIMRPAEPDTRRVVYAADVPGGHRWVVVMARWEDRWAVNWFAGPSGADPARLTEAYAPVPWSEFAPLALMDASAELSPLLVLGEPGTSADYSPSRDRASDGQLVRDFEPLPELDGVLLGTVPTPVTWDAGELHEVRGRNRGRVLEVLVTGGAPWSSWYTGVDGLPDDAVLGPCLTALGLPVDDGPGRHDLSWTDIGRDDLASVEAAARDEAVATCHAQATGG
jgi:hypothetical protein